MKVDSCKDYNCPFNGTLKIYGCGSSYSQISQRTVKYVERRFEELTKGHNAHMDVLIFDRYGSSSAKPDRILYKDGDFMDFVDIFFKRAKDDNAIVDKLISVYNGFQNIKSFKESVKNIFRE